MLAALAEYSREKMTFKCKDDCTLTKHTRRWTYGFNVWPLKKQIEFCATYWVLHIPALRILFWNPSLQMENQLRKVNMGQGGVDQYNKVWSVFISSISLLPCNNNNNFIYNNMSPAEYEADFFFEKNSYFSGVIYSSIKICIFGTQVLLLQNTTVTSLEHNCHIF